jgi:hypothetical protein
VISPEHGRVGGSLQRWDWLWSRTLVSSGGYAPNICREVDLSTHPYASVELIRAQLRVLARAICKANSLCVAMADVDAGTAAIGIPVECSLRRVVFSKTCG